MSARATEEAMALESQRAASRLGDPTTWVDRYGDALLRFALSRVGRREVAEDLVQETFLAGWQARATFDGRASLGTWLGGILRRKVADYYRRKGRELVQFDVEASDQAGPLFDGSLDPYDVGTFLMTQVTNDTKSERRREVSDRLACNSMPVKALHNDADA